MNQNIDKDLARQVSITIKEDMVSRRVALKSALALGCGVLLPVVLIGCDSKQNDGSTNSSRAAPPDTSDTGAKSATASGAPTPATNSTAKAPPATTNSSTAPAAPGKVSQASVQYQDMPKGDQKCSGCALFVEPRACLVVEGDISPEGWSALWAPKAS